MAVRVGHEDGVVIDSEVRRRNVLDVEDQLAEPALLSVVDHFVFGSWLRRVAQGRERNPIDDTDIIPAAL